jgi:hypothetical protein
MLPTVCLLSAAACFLLLLAAAVLPWPMLPPPISATCAGAYCVCVFTTVRVCSLSLSSDCLAITLEMPFKDPLGDLQPSTGWNGARSAELGDSTVEVIADIVHKLR